jgi:hypothetical protein
MRDCLRFGSPAAAHAAVGKCLPVKWFIVTKPLGVQPSSIWGDALSARAHVVKGHVARSVWGAGELQAAEGATHLGSVICSA